MKPNSLFVNAIVVFALGRSVHRKASPARTAVVQTFSAHIAHFTNDMWKDAIIVIN